MTGRLAGKTAFCTASGAGIGRAVAIAFAREGAKVIASDIDLGKLKGLARGGRRRDASARRAQHRVGRGDGQAQSGRSTSCSTPPASSITAPCSTAPTRTGTSPSTSTSSRCTARSGRSCRACWSKGSGSIVNIASGAGSVRGIPNRYVYGATKAAVIGLTKAVAADFIRKGVRCNAICPGTIQSPSLDDRIATQAKAHGKPSRGGAPGLRRPPADGPARHAEEIAALAVYLAGGRKRLHHRPDLPRRRRLRALSRGLRPVQVAVAACHARRPDAWWRCSMPPTPATAFCSASSRSRSGRLSRGSARAGQSGSREDLRAPTVVGALVLEPRAATCDREHRHAIRAASGHGAWAFLLAAEERSAARGLTMSSASIPGRSSTPSPGWYARHGYRSRAHRGVERPLDHAHDQAAFQPDPDRKASSMPRFAANLSFMFNEVPFLDRFEAAAKAGFKGVRVPVSLRLPGKARSPPA